MTKVIAIAGLPCCGKTTLCNSIAIDRNALSVDLEYFRTIFFEENINDNVLKYTNNEAIKDNEDLRTYFLRCVIYDNIINIDEYVNWYKVIMIDMNKKINIMLNDFEKNSYEIFLNKYKPIIKYSPLEKPKLLVLNHALLPLTDIWKNANLSVMLTGEENVLIERFVNREKIKKEKYQKDILKHMKLYTILNHNSDAKIIYDTTKNFININDFNNLCERENI